MLDTQVPQSHHGVLVNVGGLGVFIIGEAGAGKSTLALALLHKGHKLIADDVVDFVSQSDSITGHAPDKLAGLLHSRELGLIDIKQIFGKQAWLNKTTLHCIIRLNSGTDTGPPTTGLHPTLNAYTICGHSMPMLTLLTQSTGCLYEHLITWLSIKHNMVIKQGKLTTRQDVYPHP